MALKLFVFAAILGLSAAGIISSPIRVASLDSEYDPHPAYSYAYDVQDALTGDSKRQQESRSGDVVRGSYSVNDPDGTRRTVDYAADPVNGFNAVVRREPQAVALARLAGPALVAHPTVALASTSSARVDAPSGITVAALPRVVSAGSPFVQLQQQQLLQPQLQQVQQIHPQLQQLQPVQQIQQVQQLQALQQQLQLQQLVNPVALATNLGLAALAGPGLLQRGPWA
ncbi:cuticle protein 19.8-like [Thrips palmi]|uniref:Cuticle protein 19.8-like n=1 Tax=Thrips palmi TaxID=161013 RepID=A0A6P9A5U8_THRPL|nr:cuticle protein 19.8-like [Thrips palmi]